MKNKATNSLIFGVMMLFLTFTISGTAGASAPNSPAQNLPATSGSGVLTIPAAAFMPMEDGYDYKNDGRYLTHLHSPGGGSDNGSYYAPVELPQGARVTRVTFYWYDDSSTSDGTAYFQGTSYDGYWFNMIDPLSTSSEYGAGSSSTSIISDDYIYNDIFFHYVVWSLPATQYIQGFSMVIEYTPPATTSGILSIPAAAFRPHEDGYDYEDHGRYLKYFHSPGGFLENGSYYAPLDLPNGAVVTKVTYYYNLTYTSGFMGGVYLQRSDIYLGNYQDMASISIHGSSQQGFSSSSTESISHATIDDWGYEYWLVVNLPVSGGGDDQQVWACGVVIEYTPPSSGPGMLTISAAAFTPHLEGNDYTNDGRYLIHLHSPGGGSANGTYYAPVHLPQGVVVNRVTFDWYDASSSQNGSAFLQRTQLDQGNYENVAGGVIPCNHGLCQYFTDIIANGTIDNLHYAYWVVWDLPATSDIEGRDFSIRYGYPLFLPVVQRN